MSELRKQMQIDMEIRGYSPIIIKYYLAHVSNFAKHFFYKTFYYTN